MSNYLEILTHSFAKWVGSAAGLVFALSSIIIWVVIGELYGFSHGWENGLMIYIATLTFLMIFIIQRSQNKELSAIHVKLNELIVSSKHADNRIVAVEELTEKEISEVQDSHRQIVTDKKDGRF